MKKSEDLLERRALWQRCKAKLGAGVPLKDREARALSDLMERIERKPDIAKSIADPEHKQIMLDMKYVVRAIKNPPDADEARQLRRVKQRAKKLLRTED